MRGKTTDPDIRAQVVADLLAGKTVTECESLYGVPKQTISTWAQDLGGIDALQQGRISDLVYKYLTENLTTLAVQSIHFRDLEWLKAQPASELATLHGVTADKAVRILAAMERGREPSSADVPVAVPVQR